MRNCWRPNVDGLKPEILKNDKSNRRETTPVLLFLFFAIFTKCIMDKTIKKKRLEDNGMGFLSFILFAFLGVCLIVGCKRACRVVVRGINYLFDKIEEKIEY